MAINIKKENKGKLTKKAKAAGQGVQAFAHHVLANKDDYARKTIQQSQFAVNAAKWKKAADGLTLPGILQAFPYTFGNNLGAPTPLPGTNQPQASQYYGPTPDPYADRDRLLAQMQPKQSSHLGPQVLSSVANGLQQAGAIVGDGGNKLGNTIGAIAPALAAIPGVGAIASPIASAVGGIINLFGHKKPEYIKPDVKIIRSPQAYNPFPSGTGSQGIFANGGEVAANGKTFHKGEKVTWNSEAGHVSGTITRIYTAPFKVYGKDGKAYTRHASKENPQYAIKSNKSDHVAHHFGDALHKAADGAELTATKAKKILKEGIANGKPLTDSQKKYFGYVAGGGDPQAANGMDVQVEDNNYTQLSPNSIELNGASHENGGQDLYDQDGNKLIEAEGGEVVTQLPDKTVVMGQMTVPGTNKSFKEVSKKLAEKQGKAQEYADNGTDLVLDNDPQDKLGIYAFNSGKAMMEGGQAKVDELTEGQQFLADEQQAILDIAKENNVDPNDLSKGKVEISTEDPDQMTNGGKLSIAQRNNNPGNIKYADWMKEFGAVPGTDKTEDDGTVYAKFPSVKQGQAALRHLLFSGHIKYYKPDTEITKALGTSYTNHKPYAQELTNKFKGRTFGSLNLQEQNELMDAITQGEDSTTYNWTNPDGTPIARTPAAPKESPVDPNAFNTVEDQTVGQAPPNPTTAPAPNPSPARAPRPAYQAYDSTFTNRQLPTNAEPFNPMQIIPEMTALKQNEQGPGVFQQSYNPQLFEPYQVTFQDRINNNNRTFNALRQSPYLADNPQALSTLAGQAYNANNQVSAEQFRTNQSIANEVTNKNIGLLNEAQMTNLKLQDQAYVRQSQAASNTKEINYQLLNSIVAKLSQHNLENKQLQATEALSDYRNVGGRFQNENGLTPDQEINWGSGFNPYAPLPSTTQRVKKDAQGNVIGSTTTSSIRRK